MSKQKREEINPNDYSYREEQMISVPAKVFETMRSYAIQQAHENEPKPMLLSVKPVFNEETKEVTFQEYESNEEYRNQQPVYINDPKAVNAMYVADLMTSAHLDNIEKGEAVDIETLKKEYNTKNSKIKKVED